MCIQQIEDLFKAADFDESGDLNLSEMGFALRMMGVKVPQDKLQTFFNEMDTDKSGGISVAEFLDYYGRQPVIWWWSFGVVRFLFCFYSDCAIYTSSEGRLLQT